MQTIVDVKNLSFSYQQEKTVSDLSFQVAQGEIFALLGPNGAGKTTTIRLLNGLLKADSGLLRILGFDPFQEGNRVRQATGVLTETSALYERLTAMQNLRFFGLLYGMQEKQIKERGQHLLEMFGLSERASQKVSSYSKGMRQRLALARALLHEPQILFLDEPTSGLDPEIARQVQDLIAQVSREHGSTVLLCTHLLYEAQRLCDRMAVMDAGRTIAVGTMQELTALTMPEKYVRVTTLAAIPKKVLDLSTKMPSVLALEKETEHQIKVQIRDHNHIAELVALYVNNNVSIYAVEPLQPTLEEVYFRLQETNKERNHAR